MLVILFIAINWITATWVRDLALDKQFAVNRQQLQLYESHLNGQLAKYRYLPTLLANSRTLLAPLRETLTPAQLDEVNHYLETISLISGASDVYLMDRQGLTIAASNWQSETPFIGRNFAYRPYFQQAMQGRLGRYFALGITSGKRGYYFAYPLSEQNQILGAIVVKVDVEDIEQHWGGQNESVLVTDLDGVIFLTTEEEWRYRLLEPKTKQVIEHIESSGRYPGAGLRPIEVVENRAHAEAGRLIRFADRPRQGEYLLQQKLMPAAGWRLYLLTPSAPVNRSVLTSLVITSSLFIGAVLFVAVLWQRQRQRKERARHASEKQRALQRANDMLEHRVEERTADLRHEIEERKRAEEALRLAQDGLVQAAKLAMLGQMSAGITHELNQPLAAIQSYAYNARMLLERKRFPEVGENLEQINELIDRMAQLSSQLKLFARKSDGQRHSVNLRQAIDVSLKLLKPQVQKSATRIDIEPGIDDIAVLADPIRLEQVLVNLLGNAMHAMADVENRWIRITTAAEGSRLRVTIHDHGPGIPPENLEQIFDPFFTTRKSGLGLGLAISQYIVKNMGGRLDADNHPNGGAIFALELDLAGGAP